MSTLREIGQQYEESLADLMKKREEGMTKIYNCLHNPDCLEDGFEEFRALQVELDRSVLAAYGWSDIDPEHDFADTPLGVRYGMSEDAEATWSITSAVTLSGRKVARRTERDGQDDDPESQGGRIWRRVPMEGSCEIELKRSSRRWSTSNCG